MDYTLDSVQHAISTLKEKFEGYKIFKKSRVFSGEELNQLKAQENKYFFGVLTCSDQRTIDLEFEENQILTVDSGSQIIEFFTSANFKDLEGLEATPEGLFRGFEIIIQH
jgi:hypothetical protein